MTTDDRSGTPVHHLPTLELFTLPGRVVIVTGGNRNLGLGLSHGRAAQRGMERPACGTDVSDPAACERMAAFAADRWGRIDILVSNGAAMFMPWVPARCTQRHTQ